MSPTAQRLSPLVSLLRCLECGAELALVDVAEEPGYPELGLDAWLACGECGERYPVIGGTPRMLDRAGRARLGSIYPEAAIDLPSDGDARAAPSVKDRTAESFAYEWEQFGGARPEWRQNFQDYLQPHPEGYLAGRLVLDVGAGSGRHSARAAELGAQIVAVDLGAAIDVARANLPDQALTVQADAERLPFAHEQFDFVMSIGVLHHLPDTELALGAITPVARRGGRVHIYVYWVPEQRLHRAILRWVTAARRVTVRLPHRALHALCYPLAAVLWLLVVLPYRGLRDHPRLARLARALPLKTYADYPFGVLLNDQFDRFSAPLERRFTRQQVQAMLERCGLEDISVIANHGWVADGRIPASQL